MLCIFCFVFFFLLVGATPEAVDGHSQLLRWVLIWPEEPQLIDLVGFAEMGWHDPVPFFDLTSKQSNVGHHSSVVVKAGVKHQGLKGVIRACYRSENPKTEGGESSGPLLCVKSLRFSNVYEGSYGGILSTTAWRTVSTFVPSLADIWKKFRL